MGFRILVADDETELVEIVQDILKSVDPALEVHPAHDGKKALELIQKQAFQLLISDINMPGLTGIELLKAVKERSPETQVIIMSAFGDAPMLVQCLKFEATDFVPKPFTQAEMEGAVRRAMIKAQHADEAHDMILELAALEEHLQDEMENLVLRSRDLIQELDKLEKTTGTDKIQRARSAAEALLKEVALLKLHKSQNER